MERDWDGESAMRKSGTATGEVEHAELCSGLRIEISVVNEANREGGVQTGWRSVNVGRSGEINRREVLR